MPRRSSKKDTPAKLAGRMKRRWRVVWARILGTVEAPDVEAAKAAAAVQFDLDESVRPRMKEGWAGDAARAGALAQPGEGRRAVTDLLLRSTTGNPSQYEVIADEEIVGRIARYNALRDQSKPWVWSVDLAFQEARHPTHGFEATREAAMQAFARSWFRGG